MSDVVTPVNLSKPKQRWVKSGMIVLIVTDNPTASQAVLTNLRELGLDVQLSLFDGHKLAAIPNEAPDAILCYFTDFVEKTQSITHALRKHFAPKTLPIIGALLRPIRSSSEHFDSVLFAPVHSLQIAHRVDSMIRLGKMETEITRRIETLRESFGQNVTLSIDDLNRPFRILFVGKAAPGFMIIINALQKKNVETVAAFTSFTAFDYLHDRQFDAVVINAIDQPEPALSISETMQKNARLYHVPTLFLVDQNNFQYSDAAYERGARDLIPVNASLDEISGRILELANYHRIHEQLKLTFSNLGGNEGLDEESGVFSAEFFNAHMKRLASDCHKQGQPLSLLAIKPYVDGDKDIDSLYLIAGIAKIGGMLKNFVRMHDVVSRYDHDTYILAFPGESETIVSRVLERIENLLKNITFESGEDKRDKVSFTLDAAIVQQNKNEDSEAFVKRLLSDLEAQSRNADFRVSA